MLKNFCSITCLLLLPVAFAMAESKMKNTELDDKLISGMSIVGNNETPKSLVIVPWKNSEIGQQSKLNSNLFNDSIIPVDKAVFMRELDFYNLGNSN